MYQTSKVLPYPADFLKEIIANVELYPQFLPWVKAVAIFPKTSGFFEADLTIGYGPLEKTYRSEVFVHKDAVEAKAISNSIFNFLESRWQLTDYENNRCLINFTLDFKLQSPLLQLTVGKLLDDAAISMITAFEQRAARLWENVTI
jgi:coenzyme Q-binding protein COQ10